MVTVLFFLLRYVFLLVLCIFIFRLVKWMVGDLREVRERHPVATGSARPVPEERELPAKTAGGRLVVMESGSSESEPGDFYLIGAGVSIGRGDSNDVVIADSFASAKHAGIYLKDGQYWLEDFNSVNGTFLNQVRVEQPTVLSSGDKIGVGRIIFQFVRWGHEVGSNY